ncbi:Alpha/Beta hydrolase protein [Dactylonectria estremocensis]|uniref:Alpha/Beta hydrolase protein n=1 Tax=Dactylonectria estremocensis TaxID=1079267 RepID=A0A9P9IR46_9HYPO|nr:Alpha/Beta hydrolase protein [Dactylonectria estremocensis]
MCDFSSYGGINEEWLAVEASLPPSTGEELSLSELRRITNQEREVQSARAMKHLSHRVYTHDYLIPTRDGSFVEARSYRPVSARNDAPLPVYIHLQGGGFVFGTLDGEDGICARVACSSQVVVLNVNYRHTPEYTYPTPWDDAEDAFEWAHDNMDKFAGDDTKVIVGGISAGAWVAASLTLQRHLARKAVRPPIAGQVLMIPCLAYPDCYEPQLQKMKHHSISSYKQNEKAPLFSVSELRYFSELLKVENPDVKDTKLNPGNASPEQVKGMPPTVLGIVGLDPLRDEGLLYAKMLTEAGVPTDVNLFMGLPHGFRWYDEKISASRRWDKVVEEGILWALTEPLPNNEFHIKT